MTIQQIIQDVQSVAGSYSEPTFHRDRRQLGIEPVKTTFPTKTAQYPGDTAALILRARGFETALLPMRPMLPPTDTAAARLTKLPTLAQLRKARKKAGRR